MKLSVQILIAFLIILLLSVIDTASNYLLSLKVEKNTEFLNKSQEIIRSSGRLHRGIIEMQSSFRGYLVSHDSITFEGFYSGLTNIPPLFTELRELVQSNKRQISDLDSIALLHKEWILYAEEIIDLANNKTRNTLPVEKIKTQLANTIYDDISRKFQEFDKLEYEMRSIHTNNLIYSIQQTHIFSLSFFALTILIGIASTIYIISVISKRISTMVKLAENISKGDFTKIEDDRKDELTSLSASLNIMSENLKKNITELERHNAELDKFAYVVSHDLKAPVRGIHNVVKWIEEDLASELSPQMKQYLDIIPQRTKRMENLINGLLSYARIREKTAPEQTDVTELVNDIVDAIVPRNFKVSIGKMPVIMTERLKLEQVFTNLISNATKYSSGSAPEIQIGCEKLEDLLYEFSVKDNGIGIEPQYHERIFEIFQTLREKDDIESTGIGLSIIKRILDDHNCKIRVVSTLGNGTEFIFTWRSEIPNPYENPYHIID
jgi:signal transduction histidine kinase